MVAEGLSEPAGIAMNRKADVMATITATIAIAPPIALAGHIVRFVGMVTPGQLTAQ